MTGLSLEGNLQLNNDTSLVRIILENQDGSQYMIYEAYPLIASQLTFSVSEACDETCFLDAVSPSSVRIQVIDAELYIKALAYDDDPQGNLRELQYE